MKYYVYIVECSDGSLYTGWTNNIRKRLEQHNRKKGSKYTRIRTPVALYHYEVYLTKSDAMKREYAIKQMTRKEKLALVDRQLFFI